MTYGRFQFKVPAPTCNHCGQPKLMCYTDPCKGTLDHVADILLRAELRPKPKPVPLIKGGQGRRRAEVEAYANTICILALVCVVVGGLMLWGLR